MILPVGGERSGAVTRRKAQEVFRDRVQQIVDREAKHSGLKPQRRGSIRTGAVIEHLDQLRQQRW